MSAESGTSRVHETGAEQSPDFRIEGRFRDLFESELSDLRKYCNFVASKYKVPSDYGDDLFAEVCHKAWESRAQLEDPTKIRSWLRRIANNSAINHLKLKSNSSQHLSLTGSAEEGNPEQFLLLDPVESPSDKMINLDLVQKFADTLSPEERTLFEQINHLGLTPTEISQKTAKNLSTLNTYLYRVRAKLNKFLKEQKNK